MKVLILGGGGFIGSSLAKKLYESSHQVNILDIFHSQIHGENYKNSPLYKMSCKYANVTVGDACDRETLEKSVGNVDVIVNLVAETGTGQSMYQITSYTNTNISGTALLFEVLQNVENQVSRIVVASSRAIYGEGKYHCSTHGYVYPKERSIANLKAGKFGVYCPICNKKAKDIPTDEESKIHPSSLYGITKQVQEQITHICGGSAQLETVALRYQNVYGPGQSLKNPYTGLLSVFTTRIRNGNNLVLFEDGKPSRDFVYIDDVVNVTYLAITKPGISNVSINVGTGVSTTIKEVADLMIGFFNSSSTYEITGNFRVGDIRTCYADNTLLKQTLRYTPQVDFASGLRNFIAWAKGEPVEIDSFEKSIKEMKDKGLYN